MRNSLKYLFVILMSVSLLGCQDQKPTASTSAKPSYAYDESLANKLGADEFGFKQYVICFLNPGIHKIMSVEENNALEKAHLSYLQPLTENGTIVLAGYFPKPQSHAGFLVLAVESIDSAKKIMSDEPKIKMGSLVPDYQYWMSSAALHKLNDIHKTVAKKNMLSN